MLTTEDHIFGIGGMILFALVAFFFIRMFVVGIFRARKHGEVMNYNVVMLCEENKDGIVTPVSGIERLASSNERIEAQLTEIAGLLRDIRDREPGAGGERLILSDDAGTPRSH